MAFWPKIQVFKKIPNLASIRGRTLASYKPNIRYPMPLLSKYNIVTLSHLNLLPLLKLVMKIDLLSLARHATEKFINGVWQKLFLKTFFKNSFCFTKSYSYNCNKGPTKAQRSLFTKHASYILKMHIQTNKFNFCLLLNVNGKYVTHFTISVLSVHRKKISECSYMATEDVQEEVCIELLNPGRYQYDMLYYQFGIQKSELESCRQNY